MGTFDIETTTAARDDALFAPSGGTFSAQTTHLQSVLRLPDGAVVLARSALEPHHAFRWGDRAWGVQFHPEFSTTHMRGYIRARSGALYREDLDPVALVAAVRAAPEARAVLQRFVRFAEAVPRG